METQQQVSFAHKYRLMVENWATIRTSLTKKDELEKLSRFTKENLAVKVKVGKLIEMSRALLFNYGASVKVAKEFSKPLLTSQIVDLSS